MNYQIVPLTLAHLRMIAPRLRAGDLAEIEASGMKPRHLLNYLYRHSTERHAAFVDGEIAAVWGCAGSLVQVTGEAWLFTTPAIERAPMAFIKEARKVLRGWLATRRQVMSSCLASYEQSVRFFALLGFEIGEPYEYGPKRAIFRHLKLER